MSRVSYARDQAIVGVGTVFIWDFGVAYTRGGQGTNLCMLKSRKSVCLSLRYITTLPISFMHVDVDNFKDDLLSCCSKHLGLLTTRRDPDDPRRATETLKIRLDMFRFEENVCGMLHQAPNLSVCIGKNIANCSKDPKFLPVICALRARCTRTSPRGTVWD